MRSSPNPQPTHAMLPPQDDPGFSPQDLTDHRKPGDWVTRYPPEARKLYYIEAVVLLLFLGLSLAIILMIYLGTFKVLVSVDERYKVLAKYGYAFAGGLLGGTLFSLKWLYHSVAKLLWHEDRRLWRFISPINSASLAFASVVLIDSGLLSIFNNENINRPSSVVGIAFIIGYFSDQALGKLGDLAQTIFGSVRPPSRNQE